MAPVPADESQKGDSYSFANHSSPLHHLQNYRTAIALVLRGETESAIEFQEGNPPFRLAPY